MIGLERLSAGIKGATRRLKHIVKPPVRVVDPPDDIVIEWDQAVVVRDGTTLRVNVFRPPGDAPVPVIMSAHPYKKDDLPINRRGGHQPAPQNRIFFQPDPIEYSTITGWEAPDPAVWVPRGYAVVNCDLRGCGTSEGTGTLFSLQEGEDYYDLIEWAGTQPWSTGKVGLLGVSYLAISQYRAASLRPPHLAAICPWEGFSDLYRDFARPGGVLESGFSVMWSAMTAKITRMHGNLRQGLKAHETRDEWYAARTPDLEAIEVPMLVCGSFSDHDLHSRGSFEAFRRAGSSQKWLYTHRSGKWSTFYSDEATRTQAQFFDWALHGAANGWEETPPVRLAIYDAGADAVEITAEQSWPPPDVAWTTYYCDWGSASLGSEPLSHERQTSFDLKQGAVVARLVVQENMDTIGPMVATLPIELRGCSDANFFVGVRKVRQGVDANFEGSYGFSGDMVTHGTWRAAFDELDAELSTPWLPVGAFTTLRRLDDGEVRTLAIPLLPQATRWKTGDVLELWVQGHWFFPRNPATGQFPAGYAPSPPGTAILHGGPTSPSTLLVGRRPH